MHTTIRLEIPHSDVHDCAIVGVLEQYDVSGDAVILDRRPIALILHGTMGHKDYLYQKRLAKRLPMSSFRFDFRGAHETPGTWRLGRFEDDITDISVVARHLATLGYNIVLVIGHSKGSVAGLSWMCSTDEGKHVKGYVNCSGRYRMERVYLDYKGYQSSFDAKGFHEWKVTVARQPVVGIIRPEDMAEFAQWDTSIIQRSFPAQTHVLTIHGLSDAMVPPYDAIIYSRIFGSRGENLGTHNLHMIEGADHNLTGRVDEVNDAICSWWEKLERSQLRTGVWGEVNIPTTSTSKL